MYMSASLDLVVSNGMVVTPHSTFKADIGVTEGKIATISAPSTLTGEKKVDASGRLVLPGLINGHVHLREPGTEYREDFETGTRAAAAGGFTVVLEMPQAKPPVSTAQSFNSRKETVAKKAIIDFGLYGGAGKDNLDHITPMCNAGVIGYKTFMINPPPGREEEYWGLYVTDNSQLFSVFRETAKTGLASAVHAEDSAVVGLLIKELRAAGRKDALAHLESRPNFVEELAINSVATIGRITGTRVHISHLSTREGLRIFKEAKLAGLKITAETCPHYLLLSEKDMNRLGPLAKINPPLRSKSDVQALWVALRDGTVDMVTDDHAPYAPYEKLKGWDDIWESQSGAPTLETTLPLLLTKVNEGWISIQRLTDVMSEAPARIFGLYPKKGSIQIGSDADFTIVDMNATTTITPDRMYTKAKELTPYSGVKVKGVPVSTVVRGRMVMEEGEVIGKAGYGRPLVPS